MSDKALTATRFRKLTLEGRIPDLWIVLARPSSLHGAAVAVRRFEERWRGLGYSSFRLRAEGKPLTDEQRALCPPELDDFLV